MDVQKTIVKVLELFKTLAILYGLSWVIFAATAFYYIKQSNSAQLSSTAPLPDPSKNKVIEFSETAIEGKTLFEQNCSQCHATSDAVVMGPGLKGIEERRKLPWLRDWIRNSAKVIASGDKYAVELFNKYNKTPMTPFSSFKDEDIDAILKYIDEVNQ